MKKIQKNYIKKNLVKLIILFITFVSFECTTSTTGPTGPTGPEPISSTCLPTEEPVGKECKLKCNPSFTRGSDGVCGCKDTEEEINNTCRARCGQNKVLNNEGICVYKDEAYPTAPDCVEWSTVISSPATFSKALSNIGCNAYLSITIKGGDGGGGGSGSSFNVASGAGGDGYFGQTTVCTLAVTQDLSLNTLIASIGKGGDFGISGTASFLNPNLTLKSGQGGKKGGESIATLVNATLANTNFICKALGGQSGEGGDIGYNPNTIALAGTNVILWNTLKSSELGYTGVGKKALTGGQAVNANANLPANVRGGNNGKDGANGTVKINFGPPIRYRVINFDSDGGDIINPLNGQIVGDSVQLPTITQIGSNFVGWQSNGTLVDINNFIMPRADVTLVAKWSFDIRNVGWNTNISNKGFYKFAITNSSTVIMTIKAANGGGGGDVPSLNRDTNNTYGYIGATKVCTLDLLPGYTTLATQSVVWVTVSVGGGGIGGTAGPNESTGGKGGKKGGDTSITSSLGNFRCFGEGGAGGNGVFRNYGINVDTAGESGFTSDGAITPYGSGINDHNGADGFVNIKVIEAVKFVNISFNANGGNPLPAASYTNLRSGSSINLPSTTRFGYNFLNWVSAGFSYLYNALFTVPRTNVEFTAVWASATCNNWERNYSADTLLPVKTLSEPVSSLPCIGPGVIVMSLRAGDGGGGGSGAKHSSWANSNSGEIGYTGEIKVCTLSLNAATDISDLILSIGNAGEGGIGGNAFFPWDPPPDAAGEGGKKGNDSSVASPSITCTAQGGAGGNGGAFSENNFPGGRSGGSGYMGGGQNGGSAGMGTVNNSDNYSGNPGGKGSPGYIKLEFRKR